MIIINQGVEIPIPDDAEWKQFTNGANNCVQATGVVLPASHPKHGMSRDGRAVAIRDSLNTDGGVQVYTGDEIKFFVEGVNKGFFSDLI